MYTSIRLLGSDTLLILWYKKKNYMKQSDDFLNFFPEILGLIY